MSEVMTKEEWESFCEHRSERNQARGIYDCTKDKFVIENAPDKLVIYADSSSGSEIYKGSIVTLKLVQEVKTEIEILVCAGKYSFGLFKLSSGGTITLRLPKTETKEDLIFLLDSMTKGGNLFVCIPYINN